MKNKTAASPGGPAPLIGLAARAALGLVLIVSGVLKAAAGPEEFAVVIEGYQLIPSQDLILALAAFLPWLEVFLGFALLTGYLTRWTAIGAGALLGVFILALGLAQARGLILPNCGCFGPGWHATPGQATALDSFLLLCSFAAFRSGAALASLDNWCLAASRP